MATVCYHFSLLRCLGLKFQSTLDDDGTSCLGMQAHGSHGIVEGLEGLGDCVLGWGCRRPAC